MSTPVSLSDLIEACDWVDSGEGAGLDCAAYVSLVTGTVHWVGDDVDEDVPDDIDDGSLYIAVPRKNDLDLGRSLALRFVEEHLPHSLETVHEIFRKRGAYSRFKALLEKAGQLEAWHRYEEAATETALREWCEDNGFELAIPGGA